MPKIEFISQAELAAVLATYNTLGETILGIRRRLEAGAGVEEGIYAADSDREDAISSYDRALNGIGMFGLNLETKGLPSDVHEEERTEKVPELVPERELPDWVTFEPLADFRLVAWESDESTVEVLLTSEEYVILKDRLARLRGFAVSQEGVHAN